MDKRDSIYYIIYYRDCNYYGFHIDVQILIANAVDKTAILTATSEIFVVVLVVVDKIRYILENSSNCSTNIAMWSCYII